MTTGTVDDFLEHFGVKGMKWGVRRKPKGAPSADAAEARGYRAQAKAGGGHHVLSNKQLQTFITRANLEQQYVRLTPTRGGKAKKFVMETLLGIGKEQAKTYVNSQVKSVLTHGSAENVTPMKNKQGAVIIDVNSRESA